MLKKGLVVPGRLKTRTPNMAIATKFEWEIPLILLCTLLFLGGGRLFKVKCLKSTFPRWGGGSGRLFEAGRLLNFSSFSVGTYSRLGT